MSWNFLICSQNLHPKQNLTIQWQRLIAPGGTSRPINSKPRTGKQDATTLNTTLGTPKSRQQFPSVALGNKWPVSQTCGTEPVHRRWLVFCDRLFYVTHPQLPPAWRVVTATVFSLWLRLRTRITTNGLGTERRRRRFDGGGSGSKTTNIM